MNILAKLWMFLIILEKSFLKFRSNVMKIWLKAFLYKYSRMNSLYNSIKNTSKTVKITSEIILNTNFQTIHRIVSRICRRKAQKIDSTEDTLIFFCISHLNLASQSPKRATQFASDHWSHALLALMVNRMLQKMVDSLAVAAAYK